MKRFLFAVALAAFLSVSIANESTALSVDQLMTMAASATRSERVEVSCNSNDGAVGFERHDPV